MEIATDTLDSESQPDNANESADPSESSSEDTPFMEAGGSLYKTKDEAIKGVQEKDSTIAQQGARIKDLESHQATADSLKDLTEALTASNQPVESEADAKAREDALMQRILDDPGQSVVVLAEMNREMEDSYDAKLQSELKKQKDSFQEQINSLAAQVRDVDPRYVQNQDKIHEIQEELGIKDDADGRKMAQGVMAMLNNGVENESRPDLPGTTVGTRVTSAPAKPVLSDKDRKELGGLGYSQEEIDTLETQYKEKEKAIA